MEKKYREAFSEISEIIKLMPESLRKKIPNDFINNIELNKDNEYNPIIKEPIEEQKLKRETEIILGIIYRDFVCSEEERKALKEKDNIELRKIMQKKDEEARKKYDVNNIFNNNKYSDEFNIKNNDNTVIQNISSKESITYNQAETENNVDKDSSNLNKKIYNSNYNNDENELSVIQENFFQKIISKIKDFIKIF